MKRVIKIVFLLYLLFIISFVSAQTPTEDLINNIIPPSPNAASFGKYGQIPVGLFTGTPQFNIPLYTIKANGIALPISINYSSNGIKVDEIASIVGLGWSFNAGGVIIRNLYDEPDEINRVEIPDTSIAYIATNDSLLSVLSTEGNDTQPDIFSFNFNGFTGKFYFNNDEAQSPVLVDPAPLKIEHLEGLGIAGTAFKITGPDGLIYWFGGNEATETTHTRPYGNVSYPNPPTPEVETAWYLTKITLLNGDEINFTYDNNYIIYESGISQSLQAKKSQSVNVNGGFPVYTAAIHEGPVVLETTTATARLVKINWPGGNIQFNYSDKVSEYTDYFKKLYNLKVFNSNEILIKKYTFDYLQVNAETNYINADNIGKITKNKYRLFLTGIKDETSNTPIDSYAFEYYSPEELPVRLSYAQDYWGYFNGKSNPDLVPRNVSRYHPNSYEDPELSKDQIISMFQNVGGDRSPDGVFGMKGLLKKITYPTKGFSLLEYEPHSYSTTEFQLPNLTTVNLSVDYGSEYSGTKTDSYSTGIIPFTQEKISLNMSVKRMCGTADIVHDKMIFAIKDENDEYLPFQVYNSGTGQYNNVETPIDIPVEGFAYAGNCYLTLQKGKKYVFSISLSTPCLDGGFRIDYYAENGQNVRVNKEIGGLRISKITNNDGHGNETVKKFFYSGINCMDCSSGQMEPVKPAVSFFTEDKVSYTSSNSLQQTTNTTVTLSSSSLNPLYNSQGYHIQYSDVIEAFGENMVGGAIWHKFNVVPNALPNYYGDPVVGTPFTNIFGTGEELEQIIYKKSGNQLIRTKKIQNTYVKDHRLQNTIEGFTISPRAHFEADYSLNTYNISTYNLNTEWHYLKQRMINEYIENGDSINTLTNYYYDNDQHLQLTRVETINSKGDTILNKNIYPNDAEEMQGISLTAQIAIDSLLKQHRITERIQTENYLNDKKLSTTRTNFAEWNGIILPNNIEISFKNNPLEKKITFNNYDSKGNLLQYHKKDDIITSFYWGYNDTYPIAKIEGLAYDSIPASVITELNKIDNGLSDVELKQINNTVRENLPDDCFITTYSYKPLIGISTMTDPNGKTTYYEYDSFGRLILIKDDEGNIIEKIDYKYKEQ